AELLEPKRRLEAEAQLAEVGERLQALLTRCEQAGVSLEALPESGGPPAEVLTLDAEPGRPALQESIDCLQEELQEMSSELDHFGKMLSSEDAFLVPDGNGQKAVFATVTTSTLGRQHRALSKVGEGGYCLLTKKCEHFSSEFVAAGTVGWRSEGSSYQFRGAVCASAAGGDSSGESGLWRLAVDGSGTTNPSKFFWKLMEMIKSSADGDFGKKSVTALQKFLNQEGFYCGSEDGDWGNTTEKALQLFLKDAGYEVDFKRGVRDGGRNTELFQEFLQDEDQDCKPDGDWGKKSAKALQNFLKGQDEKTFDALYKGKEDGDMGAATILALQKFLTQRGCDPGPLDRGLGKQTVTALQKFLAMQPDVLELKAKKLGKKAKASKSSGAAAVHVGSAPKEKKKESAEVKIRKEMEETAVMMVRAKKDVRLTYRAVGSSTGQKEFSQLSDTDFNASLSDFGSGDIPMSS
ncbi:unnamed protein product, partial [Effrenium voratum]